MILAGNRASFRMFNEAWLRVMRSPTSWHDRTPVSSGLQCSKRICSVAELQTGRILSRMSKGEFDAVIQRCWSSPADVQQIDNWLAQNWNSYLQRVASVFGTFFLVTYSFPWLAFMFIPIVGYFVRISVHSYELP